MLIDQDLVKIKVLGTGGAGGNAINDMISSGVGGVEYIAANTDAQDLGKSLADVRIQLGEKLTRGLGAGADPEIGRQAAEEDVEKIKALLEETDMLFITAGMGGGTGTGSAPVIASVAKELGVLTVAIVTRPFSFEGKKRKNNADMGIEKLKSAVDALVIIPNDKLFELPDKTITLQNAFKEANNILKIGIKGVADLMIGNGLINLDFADVKATMLNSGIAVLGFGEGEGENRAIKATEKALQSPLLEKSILGASKILINITGSPDITLMEAQTIADMVRDAAGKTADDVMFGLVTDEEFGDRVQVTIIANNFANEEEKNEPFINIDTAKSEKAANEVKEETEKTNLDLPPWVRKR
ncbi:Cell division protein FtsZ [Fusobacterium sp. DD29]|uniref:cell division protein FtsZ n=1 Tax=unclassified Fusobacterium TaxID=2648384 RepID=UPI001B8D90E7|nr:MULTISPECIES: cell division protein FtsZ [unclassified Fusobacterium]MBR8701880.1 Cell division protein FtsZ [Fusobacterium sp. DD45]MBR8711668.1 Cell division protein FtsZ [Fusobacterium sp. DD28]MBR8749784.1 Cell division protein FtsZ [Fusobacterium sp. DD29]MBR8752210.1 Cell division protein FtsZ [Fusobacterium sp. DD26]MBR8762026.1 Cell division protein FtsZ [Fusobacterium sp. DD25]